MDLNSQCASLLPLRLPGTAALCHHLLPLMVNSQGEKLRPIHLLVLSVMHRPSSKSVLLKGLCGVRSTASGMPGCQVRGWACGPRALADTAFSLPEKYPWQNHSWGAGLRSGHWSPGGWRWPHSGQCVWSWCHPRSKSAPTCPPWCLGQRTLRVRGGHNPSTHGACGMTQNLLSMIWLALLYIIHSPSKDEETCQSCGVACSE